MRYRLNTIAGSAEKELRPFVWHISDEQLEADRIEVWRIVFDGSPEERHQLAVADLFAQLAQEHISPVPGVSTDAEHV